MFTTPERNRRTEREADRIHRLQMTSPSHRRNRVRRASINMEPIPQPHFANPALLPNFNPQPNPIPQNDDPFAPPMHSRNLQNPMIHPPALNARHIAIRTRNLIRTTMQPNSQSHGQSNVPQPNPDSNQDNPMPQQHNSQAIHSARLQELHRQRDELEHQDREYRERREQERRRRQHHTPPPHPDLNQDDATLWQLSTQEAHFAQLQQLYRQREALERQEQEQRERREQEAEQRRQARVDQQQLREHREQERRQRREEARVHQEQLHERQEQERQERERLANIPAARRPYSDPLTRHTVGSMDIECQHCRALHFGGEKLSASRVNNPKFGLCCLQGQVRLPLLPEPPATLRDLLCGRSPLSPHFHKHIRQYNAALSFTSLGVKVDDSVTGTAGVYSFRIHGELCHRMGSLLPENETMNKSYAQLYVHDSDEALDIRQRRNPTCDRSVMQTLQDMLYNVNPFIPLYKQAYAPQVSASRCFSQSKKRAQKQPILYILKFLQV
jgi:hypothetical protein